MARSPAEQPAAQLAKLAFRRLATERLEPTPENYEKAYRQESGDATGSSGEVLATLIERIVRGMERGGRNWTAARRKESIQRVIAGSRSDPKRLQQRLAQLINSWDSDGASAELDTAVAMSGPIEPELPTAANDAAAAPPAAAVDDSIGPAWARVAESLSSALQQALPQQDEANRELGAELARLNERLAAEGASAPLAEEMHETCLRAERVLQHRHHLFDQLGKLCHELTSSLADLAENDSWVKGQCDAMRMKIEEGLTARGVRSVSDMLHHARVRHAEVKGEREKARDALKHLIHQMLAELGELGSKTGDFHKSVGRYAEVIEEADSLESLTGVVREMVNESRAVQTLVQQTQARLQEEHSKATGLSERVVKLEDEMRRLSDEVSTDQLTQIANRRGLMQAFEVELAKLKRNGGELSIGLLDIDNFKRLNDELGHSAGDEALKSLAAIVSKTLRPSDRVARYGGEEFVVLLPETPVGDGEQILTRLQRSLTGGLFMHKEKQVFVTFSAGVTGYRLEERIEDSLERADQALYEAKRSGKNRTCIG
ncbi:MAG: GGDEF domain-containing protein [Burkholderiales bacterium]|nr:GGDEF domain-containing protein [Burkholderiales bacterium]